MPHTSSQRVAVLSRKNFALILPPYVIRNFYSHGSEIFFRSCNSASQILPAFMDPQNSMGYVGAHLIEALCYNLEGHGFKSRWGHWNFSLS
jgi:hypothetical protein